jgi:tetratricopeptide (TPR) repeat protein
MFPTKPMPASWPWLFLSLSRSAWQVVPARTNLLLYPFVKDENAFQHALDSINALIVESPKQAALYDYRSQLYLAVDSLPAATLDLERALRLDSTNVNRQLRMGDLYYRREAVAKAKLRFEAAAKLDPKNTQAKLKMAEIDLLLRNYRESMGPGERSPPDRSTLPHTATTSKAGSTWKPVTPPWLH